MAMETVLTVRTEELDPVAPPIVEIIAPTGPVRRAAPSAPAMMTAIHTTEAEEAALIHDAFASTTRTPRLQELDTHTRIQIVLPRVDGPMM